MMQIVTPTKHSWFPELLQERDRQAGDVHPLHLQATWAPPGEWQLHRGCIHTTVACRVAQLEWHGVDSGNELPPATRVAAQGDPLPQDTLPLWQGKGDDLLLLSLFINTIIKLRIKNYVVQTLCLFTYEKYIYIRLSVLSASSLWCLFIIDGCNSDEVMHDWEEIKKTNANFFQHKFF